MSTLKVDAIRHNSATSDAITTASDGTCTANLTSINGGGRLSHRNKIINGAMIFSQRGTSFDVNTSSDYTLDRFQLVHSGGITYDATVTQDSSAPEGFRKSLKISPDTVETSMSDSENAMIQTKLEGQDCQDFAFGTSSAKKVTISFYAKSGSQNNNHQYTLQIRKYDDSNNRNMVNRAFTVTTSWQRYIMTFDGDTAENIRNDNATGMQIAWHLATGPNDIHGASTTFGRTVNNSLYSGVTGQSNFLDNTNNEFYLTGVQLEVGDTATTFEHRGYGEELVRCLRYYWRHGRGSTTTSVGIGMGWASNEVDVPITFPVPMRSEPQLSDQGTGNNYFQVEGAGNPAYIDGNWTVQFANTYGCNIYAAPDSSVTAGNAYHITMRNSAAYIGFQAEL